MKAIIACDQNGGIGYKNKLPWRNIQGDLPRFKSLTSGQIVIMGRNTWESLPQKPLKGRINFIVSARQLDLPLWAFQIPDLSFFEGYIDAWIIGGAQLINSNWNMIHEVHLTKTITEYTCDSFINLVQLENEFACEESNNFTDHVYQIWKRK